MFQEMMVASGGGGGSAEWIEATYSSNKTVLDFAWNYNADSIMLIFKWPSGGTPPAVRTIMYIDVTTGKAWVSDEQSNFQAVNSLANWGFPAATTVLQPRQLHLQHVNAYPFDWAYIVPMANGTALIT